MIKVIDDWYITVDSYPTNYTVRRGEGNKGKMASGSTSQKVTSIRWMERLKR